MNIFRRIVRLGEHDLRTAEDHLDVPVADEEPHEDFSMKWKINDIAIVYLQHDVNFNGELKFKARREFISN